MGRGFIRLVCLALAFAACSPAAAPGPAPTPREVRRIVTLLPNLTEIVVELGAADRIVGCTTYCPRAGLRPEVVNVGPPASPNLERIAALRPDLILLQDTQRETRERLRAMGLRAEAVPAIGFTDVLVATRRIAELLGRKEAGDQLANRITSELAAVAKSVQGATPVRTLPVFGHDPSALRQIYAIGPSSFLSILLENAGGLTVVPPSPVPYPVIGVEEILKLNPQAVLVLLPGADGSPTAQERERKLWSSLGYLDAVKHGRIYLLTDPDILTPGPRMGQIAAQFAKLLHPEVKP